jgi:hypothetical protein
LLSAWTSIIDHKLYLFMSGTRKHHRSSLSPVQSRRQEDGDNIRWFWWKLVPDQQRCSWAGTADCHLSTWT